MTVGAIWMSGASGFVGSHLLPLLRDTASEVRCLSHRRGTSPAQSDGEVDRLQCDFTDAKAVQKAVRLFGVPDVFVHLGWGWMTDPGAPEHLTTNVAMSTTLMDTLMDAGLRRFVFVSTVNEYGAREGMLAEDMPAVGRMTNYAKGKALVTAHGLQRVQVKGQSFLSVRLYYTYGPNQREGSLLNKLLACHREGVPPQLGPCEHYRDYIYVKDAAEGIRRLCGVDCTGIVNLGSGRAVQVRDFVRLFWSCLGGDPSGLRFGGLPMRAGEPEQPLSFASLDRLRSLLGWVPQTSLQQGLQETVAACAGRTCELVHSFVAPALCRRVFKTPRQSGAATAEKT